MLYSFGADLGDGFAPYGPLIFDKAGNILGTTYIGGHREHGTVFEMTPPVNQGGVWTESVIYEFSGAIDGSGIIAGVVLDKAGNLYGASYTGGPDGFGTVFKLSPPGAQVERWTETTLHSFTGNHEGTNAYGTLIIDPTGSLYGTTGYGGQGQGDAGYGTVFKLVP